MLIKGLQKLTLLDFPGKMACTVFTYGCNFRCPFCHNASLVLKREGDGEYIKEEDFFDFLSSRRGRLQGVCISGGEPTLQKDIIRFAKKIKDLGFLIKLDTNGYEPSVLKKMAGEGLIDYVAMDIKNSKEKYAKTVGLENFDITRIEESADFLMKGRLPFEFRTTVFAPYHEASDMEAIGEWLRGEESFFLQEFKDSGDLLGDGVYGYDKASMEYLLNVLKAYIPNARLRG